jgi:DNA invertase Pin-like site-specific DNA recombinase
MRVTCHPDDRAHAEAAGHLVVTEDAEAVFFHEAPDDETLESMVEHAKVPIIIEIDGCTADTDFPSWARGWFARRNQHRRKISAGVRRAMDAGYRPKRRLAPRTEAFVRSLIDLGLPNSVIARKAHCNSKTVKKIREEMA